VIYFRFFFALVAGGLIGSGLTANHFYSITKDSSQVEFDAISIGMNSFYGLILCIGVAIAVEVSAILIQKRTKLANG